MAGRPRRGTRRPVDQFLSLRQQLLRHEFERRFIKFGRVVGLNGTVGGLSVGQKNSSFATERTDKIVGVSTAKRFYSFALGIGYEHRLTGTGGSEEMIIGDITKLSASLGWVVSKDIRFLIEGTTLNIREGENNFIQSFLDEKVTFGSIKPQLQLRVGRSIDFTLGAQFRTKRISREELTLARFWSLDGAYGNSVFSGLSFSI